MVSAARSAFISKGKWLKRYTKLENGVPDACTFRNVVRAIDTRQPHTVFIEWLKNAAENITGVVAIDGKHVRGHRKQALLGLGYTVSQRQKQSQD